MPGIHPRSRQQVRWAFAAEARGELRPGASTPWTSPVAREKRSIAREWAHRWKCWSWDKQTRGKLPKDCKSAIELLQKIHDEHPTWSVPKGVKVPPKRKPRAMPGRVYTFPKKPERILIAAYKAPKKRRRRAA